MQAVSQDSELDLGATGVAPEMEYICAVTREAKPAAEMIRFAVDNRQVVPDVRRKWAIGDAVRRNVFARGFKRDIGIAPDLTAQTEQMIELAALDALAIAGNAGDQRVFQGKNDGWPGRSPGMHSRCQCR